MRDGNTMSRKEFLIDHIVFIITFFIFFNGLLFRSIGFHTRSESLVILWCLIIVLNLFGMAICWGSRRNRLSVFCDICIPYGVYAFITYSQNFPVLWLTVAVVAIILSAIYCWVILSRKIKRQEHKKAIIKRRLMRCFFGIRTVVSVCLVIIIGVLSFNIILGNSLVPVTVDAEIDDEGDKWTVKNNIDTVLKLREEMWVKLSSQEKLNTIQVIANIEANYLGLPHELNAALGALDEQTISVYADQSHIITINIDCFDSYSASEMLNSVCHEAYHAYQYRIIDAHETVDEPYKDLLLFYYAEKYKQEFDTYVDGNNDFKEYYTQVCESHARDYAKSATENYYKLIEQHLIDTGQIAAPQESA